jgi:hypothetical protein
MAKPRKRGTVRSSSKQRKTRISRLDHPRSAAEQAPDSRGKLIYRGTIGELRRLTWTAGVRGRWNPLPHGVWQFRCRDGAGMNWSSTRGTIWFDGPDPAMLRQIVVAAIRARIYQRSS